MRRLQQSQSSSRPIVVCIPPIAANSFAAKSRKGDESDFPKRGSIVIQAPKGGPILETPGVGTDRNDRLLQWKSVVNGIVVQ